MSDRDLVQVVVDEAVDFFEWVESTLRYRAARQSIISDLGGSPTRAGAADDPDAAHDVVQGPTFASIKAYRDATDPGAEAQVQVLLDLATLLDVLATQVEAWDLPAGAQAEEAGHGLLELLGSTYVRLRWPRLFLLLQALTLFDELASTYGLLTNPVTEIGAGLRRLVELLFDPVGLLKAVGELVEGILTTAGGLVGAPHPTGGLLEQTAEHVELLARIGAAVGGFVVAKRAEDGRGFLLTDVLVGWDSPELSLDAPTAPTVVDVLSATLVSFALGWGGQPLPAPGDNGVATSRLLVTLATIPASLGGPSLFVGLGGVLDVEETYDRWKLDLKLEADAATALQIGGDPGFRVLPPDTGSTFRASIGITSIPNASTAVTTSIGLLLGTKLEIGQIGFGLTINETGAELLMTINNLALVLDPRGQDPFVASAAQRSRIRLALDLVVGYSSSRGLVLEGSPAAAGSASVPAPVSGNAPAGRSVLDLTVPLGKAIGPVTVHNVALRVSRGTTPEQKTLTVEADTSFSVASGPFYLRLDQVGALASSDGGLRNLDVDVKGPSAVTVEISTAAVTGGGTIAHDPGNGIYFGVLDLVFHPHLSLTAIALISTRDPDSEDGWSLIVIVTADGLNWHLGMDFWLEGLGALLALNRTFDLAAMRTALPSGQLRNVLFPQDPVRHSAEILKSLQTLFPARRGSSLFGVLAKVGWNRPALIEFELGVLYEWGIQHRLILLGRVSADLPTREHAVLTFRMDAVGVLDLDAGTFALDATLYDSKLCGRFVLTGAMAMRIGFGDGFALAIGGVHPRFTPPRSLPPVPRLQIALTNGDNPKLICQAYFALTSNTVQFGADVSLYASACGFSITGDAGFDVLIRLLPFHFRAEVHASVQLKHGSHNLFKVSFDGALEGPLPLRINAKASFEILWCSFSVPIALTLVSGQAVEALVPIDVLGALLEVLAKPTSWSSQLPDGSGQVVVTGQVTSAATVLHPLGTLRVRQHLVPLDLTRDIDLVGTSTPTGERRFRVSALTLGPTTHEPQPVQDLFAPSQFFSMTDDEKLAAPSFERMDAGAELGTDGYEVDLVASRRSGFAYDTITLGADGTPTDTTPHTEPGSRVLDQMATSAASRARTRTTLARRFAAPVLRTAPTVRPARWAAVPSDVTTAPLAGAPTTWAEARGAALAAEDPTAWLVVASQEVAAS